MEAPETSEILSAVRAALAGRGRLVLAVSGGVDSMVLLHAAVRAGAAERLCIATFDHGTGDAARSAVQLVESEATRRGVRVRVGRARLAGATEAQWRAARWDFLRHVAQAERAVVVTGHTQDDQVETVVLRVLRGAGVRGLAGLFATTDIVRPLLPVRRATIAAYANRYRVRFVEDPSNASLAFLRNRVRHGLLPAIRALNPTFEDEMLDLAREAAQVRRELDERAAEMLVSQPHRGMSRVPADALEGMSDEALRLLWQSLAHASGIRLDWRGTVRLSRFTQVSRPGQSVPLSGGSDVIRDASAYVLRSAANRKLETGTVPLDHELTFGDWHFHRLEAEETPLLASAWVAAVPADRRLTVRSWQAGDRLVLGTAAGRIGRKSSRRVARFFADAGVAGPLRRGWPVVLSAGKVIWIPGIRSAVRASRASRNTILYLCEHRPG